VVQACADRINNPKDREAVLQLLWI
jgi:hypothetical protein